MERIKKEHGAQVQTSSKSGTNAKPSSQFNDNRPQTKQIAQLKRLASQSAINQHTPIQKKENNTGLPDNLKSGIENLSGYSMDDVKVHYNSAKPTQLQAHAYAQGSEIHLASGQEKHLPHEAWHVVQQKQGRVKPTKQLKDKVNVNDDSGLEKEADIMGAKALQLKSVESPILNLKNAQKRSPINVFSEANNAVVQRVGDGLADSKISGSYALSLTGELFKSIPINRYKLLDSSINTALDHVGVPAVKVSIVGARGSAEFDAEKWVMKIPGNILESKDEKIIAELVGTVYHEARHAEQYFRVAQKSALDKNEIQLFRLKLPDKIREEAVKTQNQFKGASKEMIAKTGEWSKSLMNPRMILEPMEKAEIEMAKQVDTYTMATKALLQTSTALSISLIDRDIDAINFEPVQAILKVQKAENAKLVECQKLVKYWTLQYRNMPHEKDAHELGWTAEDSFRTGKPQKEHDKTYQNRFPSEDKIWKALKIVDLNIEALDKLIGDLTIKTKSAKKLGDSDDDSDDDFDDDFDDDDFSIPPEVEARRLAEIKTKQKNGVEFDKAYQEALIYCQSKVKEKSKKPMEALPVEKKEILQILLMINGGLNFFGGAEKQYRAAISSLIFRRTNI